MKEEGPKPLFLRYSEPTCLKWLEALFLFLGLTTLLCRCLLRGLLGLLALLCCHFFLLVVWYYLLAVWIQLSFEC